MADREEDDQKHDASGALDPPRFPPLEESTLLDESHAQKARANSFFSTAQYSQAVGEYNKALSSCPNYLEYEIAVLKSNIAACHLKLEEWKAAVDSASAALDALERLISATSSKPTDRTENEDSVVEIEGEGEAAQEQLKHLKINDQRKDDIKRIKAKALMRRAKAKTEIAGWGNLQGAEDDYKALAQMPSLPPQDLKIVQAALRSLPPRINAAKEQEMGDMMGKLKDLGNGILKPFGLSTDNFNMVKDEKTGGYSMNFNQGR